MAPLRRYLRITPYTVLELRIHLSDPYQLPWLLSPSPTHLSHTTDPLPPILPRIITAIRPYVLRQLREERERASAPKSAKKKKVTKDVAVEEDFEASVFLTEGGTRHNLLVKTRGFGERKGGKGVKRRKGGGKLTGWLEGSRTRPVELGLDGEDGEEVVAVREEESDAEQGGEKLHEYEEISDDEGFAQTQKRRAGEADAQDDDKKKKALDLSYDGFAIYGKTLCLVVKRRGAGAKRRGGGGSTVESAEQSGRAMMETWVSTQAEALAEGGMGVD